METIHKFYVLYLLDNKNVSREATLKEKIHYAKIRSVWRFLKKLKIDLP